MLSPMVEHGGPHRQHTTIGASVKIVPHRHSIRPIRIDRTTALEQLRNEGTEMERTQPIEQVREGDAAWGGCVRFLAAANLAQPRSTIEPSRLMQCNEFNLSLLERNELKKKPTTTLTPAPPAVQLCATRERCRAAVTRFPDSQRQDVCHGTGAVRVHKFAHLQQHAHADQSIGTSTNWHRARQGERFNPPPFPNGPSDLAATTVCLSTRDARSRRTAIVNIRSGT